MLTGTGSPHQSCEGPCCGRQLRSSRCTDHPFHRTRQPAGWVQSPERDSVPLAVPPEPSGSLPLPPPPSGTWECPGQVAVTGPHSPRLPGSCSAAEDGSPGSPAVGAQRSHARGFGGATRCRSQEARPAPSCLHRCGRRWGLNVPFPALRPGGPPWLVLSQGPSPADLEPRAAHLAAASLGWGSQAPAPPTVDVSALLSPQERTFLLLLPLHLPHLGTWHRAAMWVSWGPGRCWVGAAFPRGSQPGSSHGLSPHSTISCPST